MSSPEHEPALPPHVQVTQMVTGLITSRAISIAAKLGVADLMKSGPRDTKDLADATNTHPGTLYRLLRLLAGLGFFQEVAPRRFENAALGNALRADDPANARAVALLLGTDASWAAWSELEKAVATGRSGFSLAHGTGMFDFLAENPDDAKVFNDAMIGFHGAEPGAVANVYDGTGIERLVDVGGGTGNMITTILKENPYMKGTLYDLPHVAEEAKKRVASLGLEDRCDVVSGSFFDEVPVGDAYMISHIIHDWDEAGCLKILGHCKRANPEAKVQVIETVVPEGNVMHLAKLLDVVMLVHTEGGQERTEKEYVELFEKAGYRLEQIIPTETPVSVIEAVPA